MVKHTMVMVMIVSCTVNSMALVPSKVSTVKKQYAIGQQCKIAYKNSHRFTEVNLCEFIGNSHRFKNSLVMIPLKCSDFASTCCHSKFWCDCSCLFVTKEGAGLVKGSITLIYSVTLLKLVLFLK